MGVYKHITRDHGINANPELLGKNIPYVDKLKGRDAVSFLKEEYDKLWSQGSVRRSLRNDAVGCISIIMDACGEEVENGIVLGSFDLEGWVKKSLDWVDKNFNPPNHEIHYKDWEGKEQTGTVDNVFCAYLHMDETAPHLHVMLMPIDERGHLSNRSYSSNGKTYRHYIDSYFEEVKEFGVERGAVGAYLPDASLRKYKSKIQEALSKTAPEPLEDESIGEYRLRMDEEMKKIYSHMQNQRMKADQELKKERSLTWCVCNEFGVPFRDRPDFKKIKEAHRKSEENELLKKAVDNCLPLELRENLYREMDKLRRLERKSKTENISYVDY